MISRARLLCVLRKRNLARRVGRRGSDRARAARRCRGSPAAGCSTRGPRRRRAGRRPRAAPVGPPAAGATAPSRASCVPVPPGDPAPPACRAGCRHRDERVLQLRDLAIRRRHSAGGDKSPPAMRCAAVRRRLSPLLRVVGEPERKSQRREAPQRPRWRGCRHHNGATRSDTTVAGSRRSSDHGQRSTGDAGDESLDAVEVRPLIGAEARRRRCSRLRSSANVALALEAAQRRPGRADRGA